MFSADMIQENDQARFEMAQASQKAAQAWRFRNIPSMEARAARAAVRVLRAAALGALELAQRTLIRTRAKMALRAAREQWSR